MKGTLSEPLVVMFIIVGIVVVSVVLITASTKVPIADMVAGIFFAPPSGGAKTTTTTITTQTTKPPSGGTITTTTTAGGATQLPEETITGCTSIIFMHNITSVSAGGSSTCGTLRKPTLFWCDLTKYSKCLVSCVAIRNPSVSSLSQVIDARHYPTGCKSVGFTSAQDCTFTKTLIGCEV